MKLPILQSLLLSPNLWRNIMTTDNINKLILHIPHSSTYLPESFYVLEDVSLDQEFQRMTDWFTDELFDFEEATKLVFPYSRLYCDVERFREDRDEPMASKGMGVCYTSTSFGTKLREVSREEKEFIKATIYDKHHKNLTALVDEALEVHETVLIIDCHSFPNEFLAQHKKSDKRPDICIGTDDFHTPSELIEYLRNCFEKEGLSVEINEPFCGTMVPLNHYHKDRRVKSVMIEVNRKLYLNEKFQKNENFNRIKQFINDTLNAID